MRWILTDWAMTGHGTWLQLPIIVCGTEVFTGDTPDDYIQQLRNMRLSDKFADGPFYTFIGQLQDAVDQGLWDGKRTRPTVA